MSVISPEFIAERNALRADALQSDYEALRIRLARRRIDVEDITRAVAGFGVAIPSWGVGTGGTRFARFPGPGERVTYSRSSKIAPSSSRSPR